MSRSEPNWLFRVLVGASLVIHAFLFLHISGFYNSKAISYIELTVQDMAKPALRNIPRPRHRPKLPPPSDIRKIQVASKPLSALRPMKIDSAETDLPDSLMESIAVPVLPDNAGLLTKWNAGTLAAYGDYTSPNDYFEMVRLQIERRKKYPEIARIRQIQV